MPRHRAPLLIVAALIFSYSDAAFAAGVVGTGTPESCTEAALEIALDGGGIVTFNCGAAPHTIVITSVKTLSASGSIDGGGTITLSGANSTAFFDIEDTTAMIIERITLTRGFGAYGAIKNTGSLLVHQARIEKCTATDAEGGAISNYQSLAVTESTFAENTSLRTGGAIFSFGGVVEITDSTFTDNSTTGSGGSEAGGALMGYQGPDFTVRNSTFTNNTATYGGAIYADATLTLENGTFNGNHCSFNGDTAPKGDGGAIWVGRDAEITDSTFTGNQAPDGTGGALYIATESTTFIDRTTFTENGSGGGGGAIANDGAVTVRGSTFHANIGPGAAIYNGIYDTSADNPASFSNTTVSDNTSSAAGAIATAYGPITLAYVTVAGNSGSSGIVEGLFGNFEFSNSVFAYNTPSNCFGLKALGQSKGFNISTDTSCELIALHDAPDTDPLLGPLADNGGPTLTRLPDPTSPAIDEAQCLPGFGTDQRGVARPQGVACDIGAVERAPEDTTTTTITTSTTTTSTVTTTSSTTTTVSSGSSCGDPVAVVVSRAARTDSVTASDALAVLNAAVGLSSCELCVCDVDDTGSISASDALATLRAAVGIAVDLDCPACD